MIILKVTILLHIAGLIVFNVMGIFGNESWHQAYYLWDKSVGGGLMLWYVVHRLLSVGDRWLTRPVLLVCALRFAFQVTVFYTGWDVNNQRWLAGIFVLLSASALFLFFKEESRANKWLSDNIPI